MRGMGLILFAMLGAVGNLRFASTPRCHSVPAFFSMTLVGVGGLSTRVGNAMMRMREGTGRKYSLLTKYNVNIPKEETDQVDDLEYAWRRLKTMANGVNEHLGGHQMQYKKTLVRNVRMFVVDVAQFRSDFEANGPGVPGLPPLEANERLRKFQRGARAQVRGVLGR